MSDNHETDPQIVHMLDQSATEFNNRKDEFELRYGFPHTCTCDTDYTEGRVGEVTFCFAGLLNDALAACERLNLENGQLQRDLDQAIILINESLPIVKEYLAEQKRDGSIPDAEGIEGADKRSEAEEGRGKTSD